MRKALIIFTIIFLSLEIVTSAQTQPSFKVKFSEPLAIFEFIKKLSTNYPDNEYKQIYKGSKYNQDKYNGLISKFDELNIYESFKYQGYPYGQKIPAMTVSLLSHNMIRSNTVEEFVHLSVGIVPNVELIELGSILIEFQPVYEDLVYNPNKETFEPQLRSISTFLSSKNISSYFDTGLKFYGSAWNNSIPFEIALLPKPGKKGFTASAFINNAVSEIPIGFEKFNSLASVLMHEIFHIQYDEQSLSMKNTVQKWFKEANYKTSQYSYLLLNEVLATSLGNGYVYKQLTGKLDTADWYNRRYINLMAKAIYPVIESYIQQGKRIDQAFIDTYVEIYEDKFPEWVLELDNLLGYRFVVSEDMGDFSYFNAIYPYSSIRTYQTPVNRKTIEDLKDTPITKVVVISSDHKRKLDLVKGEFQELKNWRFDASKEFGYAVLLQDKTFLIIINKRGTKLETLMNTQFKNQKIFIHE